MTAIPNEFRALYVEKDGEDVSVAFRTLRPEDLPPGEVTIRVAYSSVNYKDGLAVIPTGRVVRRYPMVPGIDLAGTVVESQDPRFQPGDEVLATSYEIGVSHFGGYSEYARIPAQWVLPLPAGLTTKEAMALGTAGLAAALSVHRLREHGVTPEQGPVLVTGATGGVGSIAVSILAQLGYHVAASTGKATEHDYLRSLGAQEILSREETSAESMRPLESQRWAGAVDPVGGATTAYLLRTTRYGGTVALCGVAGGAAVATTVFPFILRGVTLAGVDTVECPMDLRREIWQHLATDWKPAGLLDPITQEIPFTDLPATLAAILRGQVRGRVVVRVGS